MSTTTTTETHKANSIQKMMSGFRKLSIFIEFFTHHFPTSATNRTSYNPPSRATD